MQRVIVTVQRDDEARGRDLEIPAETPAARLAELIVQALRWPVDSPAGPITYRIEAHPPGRMLRGDETLADAGAWDGARLMLAQETAPETVPETAPVGFRWRRLGGLPDAGEPAVPTPDAPALDPPSPDATGPNAIGPNAIGPDIPTGPGRSGSPFRFNPIPSLPTSVPPPAPSPSPASPPSPSPAPAPTADPAPEPAPDEPSSRGFVWKQLDG
jgi:hypothetical protein